VSASPPPLPNTHAPDACYVRMPTCCRTRALNVVACACGESIARRLMASVASSSQSTTSIPSRPRSSSLAPQVSANPYRESERERTRELAYRWHPRCLRARGVTWACVCGHVVSHGHVCCLAMSCSVTGPCLLLSKHHVLVTVPLMLLKFQAQR
jgi:hypothetical protein